MAALCVGVDASKGRDSLSIVVGVDTSKDRGSHSMAVRFGFSGIRGASHHGTTGATTALHVKP